ncbi:MAG: HD domain-containing protein [Asgard group archaeon]|nr:HD domain-containing protein [Asgard group archaeon]
MYQAFSYIPDISISVWRLNQILSIIQERISKLSEENRELPITWSAAHMYSTSQLAKLLAFKRGIDPELAGMTGAFHDIYTVLTGMRDDHDSKAESFIFDIVDEYNEHWREDLPEITEEEIALIINAVKGHSDKVVITDNPLRELLKDVDSLDSYLYGMPITEKSGRPARVKKILAELTIPHEVKVYVKKT